MKGQYVEKVRSEVEINVNSLKEGLALAIPAKDLPYVLRLSTYS